jgi:hypothetical protein
MKKIKSVVNTNPGRLYAERGVNNFSVRNLLLKRVLLKTDLKMTVKSFEYNF